MEMDNFIIEVDTTIGNKELRLPKPKTEGQRLTLKSVGNGMVFIKGQISPLSSGVEISLEAEDITPSQDLTTLKWELKSTTYNN